MTVSSGVNLSNIDLSGGIGKEELLAALDAVKTFVSSTTDVPDLEPALQA